MERINKASGFCKFTLFRDEKGRNLQKPLAARCCRFILGIYLCVQIKKGLIKIIPLKNKILDWLPLLRSSRHLWNKSLIFWQMHCF